VPIPDYRNAMRDAGLATAHGIGIAAEDRRIRFEPEGRPLIRTICAVSDAHLDGTLARHSRAV
jgi:hypothetical protein